MKPETKKLNYNIVISLFIAVLFASSIWISKMYFTKTEIVINEDPSEAYDALTFLTAMNAFPNSDIPKDGYANAWKKHLHILNKPNPALRTTWQNLGPNNVGGRTISIAIDPVDTSVIFLGSASGGLWKSTKGGIGINAWEYMPTGFPVLGVGAIAISPTNNSEIIIGTGETYAYGTSTNGLADRTQRGSVGIGILKSTDGGSSWTHVLNWDYQQGSGVWDVVYNPANTSIVYAATTEGIYKSTDGGDTWNLSLDRKMVMDLVVDQTTPDVIYAGVGNEDSQDKGIYKSIDAGNTWLLLTNGLPPYTNDGRITLAAYPGDHNRLMAIIGNRYLTVGTYLTTDAGNTWTLQTTKDIVTYQGWYAKGLLIKTEESAKVLAGGVSLYRSTNSGLSFNSIGSVHSDIHDIISNPYNSNKVYCITDGGLYRSNNFGSTWYSCTDGYVTSQHYIGSVSSQNSQTALGGLQDNNTQRYSGTTYWESVFGGDGSYNSIDNANDDKMYASSQYLNIGKSSNGGSSFSSIYNSPSDAEGNNPAAFLAPFVVAPSNTNTIYAGNQTLLKTTDGGNSWIEKQPYPVDNGNYVLSIATSYTNADTVYFATAPTTDFTMHVYRSGDGGNTITDISTGLPNRYPRRIIVNPENSKEIYIVYSGFSGIDGGHIFKSNDAGSSWFDISSSLPDLPFHCLAIDPNNPSNIYAGCDYTVYVSSNGGSDWFTYADGFPDAVMIFDLVISPSDNSILAFTHGNGVYKNDLLEDATLANNLIQENMVVVWPNPASSFFKIKFDHFDSEISIKIFELNGKLIRESHYEVMQNITVNTQGLSQGNYLLSVTGNTINYSTKIAIVK
jgi:photosystem II stability/assembly factor-like uncharacterized protein